MKKLNYTTVEDLLVDDGFLAWYRKTDETEVDKWNGWIEADPEHQCLAEEAIHLLKLILLAEEKVEVTEQQIKAGFNRIANVIAACEKQQGNTSIK
ncbi:MAG TPA: hypothetical protein VJ111_16540 [Chitinophagaceae bacterium]|nr:hypothetical protein [Chitinophagaceae bacterium]